MFVKHLEEWPCECLIRNSGVRFMWCLYFAEVMIRNILKCFELWVLFDVLWVLEKFLTDIFLLTQTMLEPTSSVTMLMVMMLLIHIAEPLTIRNLKKNQGYHITWRVLAHCICVSVFIVHYYGRASLLYAHPVCEQLCDESLVTCLPIAYPRGHLLITVI